MDAKRSFHPYARPAQTPSQTRDTSHLSFDTFLLPDTCEFVL